MYLAELNYLDELKQVLAMSDRVCWIEMGACQKLIFESWKRGMIFKWLIYLLEQMRPELHMLEWLKVDLESLKLLRIYLIFLQSPMI